jgi:hypothetical protein
MGDLLWRLMFATVWIVLFAVGARLLIPVFGSACMDCIGGHPVPGGYYFGEGGFKVPWDLVIWVSALVATFGTGLFVVKSRALRRRPSSVV